MDHETKMELTIISSQGDAFSFDDALFMSIEITTTSNIIDVIRWFFSLSTENFIY